MWKTQRAGLNAGHSGAPEPLWRVVSASVPKLSIAKCNYVTLGPVLVSAVSLLLGHRHRNSAKPTPSADSGRGLVFAAPPGTLKHHVSKHANSICASLLLYLPRHRGWHAYLSIISLHLSLHQSLRTTPTSVSRRLWSCILRHGGSIQNGDNQGQTHRGGSGRLSRRFQFDL